MSLSYSVWRQLPDYTEVRVTEMDFTDINQAIKRSETEARKWRKVKNAPTKPRKPERIPVLILVKQLRESHWIGTYQATVHALEV